MLRGAEIWFCYLSSKWPRDQGPAGLARQDRRIWRGAEALKNGIEEFLEVNYLCMVGIDRRDRTAAAPSGRDCFAFRHG